MPSLASAAKMQQDYMVVLMTFQLTAGGATPSAPRLAGPQTKLLRTPEGARQSFGPGELRPPTAQKRIEVARRHEPAAVRPPQKELPPPVKWPPDPKEAMARRAEVQLRLGATIQKVLAMGATGSFRSCESAFGNYLLPVIPYHLEGKKSTISPQPSHASPASASWSAGPLQ
eukprot:SM000082S22849  [mRNA]  locus=s82:212029:213189:- [translate_table: standard]